MSDVRRLRRALRRDFGELPSGLSLRVEDSRAAQGGEPGRTAQTSASSVEPSSRPRSQTECIVEWLGRVEYGEVLALQREWASARTQGLAEDCLLLLEHPPVITLGRGAKRRHLLAGADLLRAQGIKVWEIERGGDITFHGPGQLVGYPILDLTRHGKDLHRYMRRLEEVLIRTLHQYGIQGERSAGQTGVWVHGAKIASIGVHVSRWVSRHGFALNVSPDLSAFDLIMPCGLSGIRMTSMAALLKRQVPVQTVAEAVAEQFALVFDCAVRWRSSPETVLSVS